MSKESTSENLKVKNSGVHAPNPPCPNDPSALGHCPLPLQVKILLYLAARHSKTAQGDKHSGISIP